MLDLITMTTVHVTAGVALTCLTVLLWRLFEDIRKNGT